MVSNEPAWSRRGFLLAGTALGATALSGCVTPGAVPLSPRARRPNIIFAFSDEHRYQSMSCSEMPELKTPHMARMAQEGFSFTRCISNYPVCAPYRAMLLTGLWPHETGVIDNTSPLPTSVTTIGHHFQRAGYATGYIGKWHLGGNRSEPYGFDHILRWMGTQEHYDTSRSYAPRGPMSKPKGYNATVMTDQAIDFVMEHARQPFLLLLSWDPPHENFHDAPEAKRALYPTGSLSKRPNFNSGRGAAGAGLGERDYEDYHAHVSAIDDELGRLMDTITAMGLQDNTILIYTSDHGSMLGSHGIEGKRQYYEESIRVPLLAWGAGFLPAGESTEALVGSIDLLPTLCGIAGVPAPASARGQDFSPWLFGDAGPAPDSQLLMNNEKRLPRVGGYGPTAFRGLRTWTFTYAASTEAPLALYDDKADPYQLENLITSEHHVELRRVLHARLVERLQEAGDPFALPLPG